MGRAGVPPTAAPRIPRFYKLHERKCEPIVMTVPRKVRPPVPLLICPFLQQAGHAIVTRARPVNGT